jgi:hypothetical protein
VGQGVYEGRSVKLEQEAKAHVEGTRIKFYEELARNTEEIEYFINKQLWPSEEKEKALEHLTAFVLWSKHCAKTHGVR